MASDAEENMVREAAAIGDIAFFEGRDLDRRDRFGKTALRVAAHNDCLPLVQWLIERGASPTAHDFDCEVRYYLKGNARAELRGERWTLLHAAAMTSSIQTMVWLIDALGIPVDVRDNGGWTPLHVLAYYPFASIEGIDALLARGADINAPDALGQNPLCHALDATIARYLVERGATVDGGDHVAPWPDERPLGINPVRPIDRFALDRDHDMVAWLIERGARVTARTLETSIFGGDAAFVDRLVEHARRRTTWPTRWRTCTTKRCSRSSRAARRACRRLRLHARSAHRGSYGRCSRAAQR